MDLRNSYASESCSQGFLDAEDCRDEPTDRETDTEPWRAGPLTRSPAQHCQGRSALSRHTALGIHGIISVKN